MPLFCNACGSPLGTPIYESPSNASLTTMNTVIPGRTEVYFCDACSHLQTTSLPNLDEYYALEYEANLASDDDDQLYKVVDGRPIYRAAHQAHMVLRKLKLPDGSRVLDYGCAKAATLRKLLAEQDTLSAFAFDVTDKYTTFWQRFIPDGQWSTFHTPDAWDGTLDVVLSFYALEHVEHPQGFLAHVRRLLRPEGTFYFIVPNAYVNIADFVVADHVNHFSDPSLRTMLGRAGFEVLEIDAISHDAAFIVLARKSGTPSVSTPDPAVVDGLRLEVDRMARFWTNAAQRVRAFEAGLPLAARRAIYGAGFYGNFIASALNNPDIVECFVDQNPHLQGRAVRGKPVVAPAALGDAVDTVLVGLNPKEARRIIEEIAEWRGRHRTLFFL